MLKLVKVLLVLITVFSAFVGGYYLGQYDAYELWNQRLSDHSVWDDTRDQQERLANYMYGGDLD